jgi:hypothetical protein
MRVGGLPYEAASTLTEIAEALAAVGDEGGAAECRARAFDIARRQGYHEITHRLETVPMRTQPARAAPPPHALDPHAAAVARAVTSLAPVGTGASADG